MGQAASRITRQEAEGLFKAFYRVSKDGFKRLFKRRAGKTTDNVVEEVVEKGSAAIKAGETHLSKNAVQP
jgi:hypothetical protein